MKTQAADAIKLHLNDALKRTITLLISVAKSDLWDCVNFSSQCEAQPWGNGLGVEGSGIPQPTCLHLWDEQQDHLVHSFSLRALLLKAL